MIEVFVFTELTPPLPPPWPVGPDTRAVALLENKLWRRLQLQEPDRCTAGCHVARRDEYRCMADRYHNHTSPPLSLTYWIKHLPSCLWNAHPPPKIRREGGFFKCLWDKWGNLRKVNNDTQQIRSPKLFLSPASPNRPDQLLTGFVPGCGSFKFHCWNVSFDPKQPLDVQFLIKSPKKSLSCLGA